DQHDHAAVISHRVSLGAGDIIAILSYDLRKEGVVEDQATRISNRGHDGAEYTPFKRLNILEEIQSHASHASDDHKELHEKLLPPAVIGDAREKRQQNRHDQKGKGQRISIQDGVLQFETQEHDLFAAGFG